MVGPQLIAQQAFFSTLRNLIMTDHTNRSNFTKGRFEQTCPGFSSWWMDLDGRSRSVALLFALLFVGSPGLAQGPNPNRPEPADALIQGAVTLNEQGQAVPVPG